MRVIITIILLYAVIGIIAGFLVVRATEKYEKEIEERIGEKIKRRNVRILVVITMIAWPRSALRFTRIILNGITAYVQDTQSREG